MDSVESAGGRLGAVLAAPRDGLVALGPAGPWLATTPTLARQVLMDPEHFDFPEDVSRSGDLSGSRAETRTGHALFPPLAPDRVEVGRETFAREWRAALADHATDEPHDAMLLLRRPVARSTAAAVLPEVEEAVRSAIADLVLAWIDALAPVIAARRPPGRWSRRRRAEERARRALDEALGALPDQDQTPVQLATLLAAGTQVPIAAGAWLLVWLAEHPAADAADDIDPVHAVWETIRLTPPTWVTARVTTAEVTLDGQRLPAGRIVMVSPLLLGRRDDLVPGDPHDLAAFAPARWADDDRRPGAWLPFGAGPHACPGRSLGMAQLTHLASWGISHEIRLVERVTIDQSRGIVPAPCRFTATARRGGTT